MVADDSVLPPTPDMFALGVTERIGYYVYLLIDPRDQTIFYIGKGTGNRCFAHVTEARLTSAFSSGDFPKLDRIRAIEAAGADVRIDILRHGLNEHEAFLVEAASIDLLPALTNEVVGHNSFERGRMTVFDINAQYAAIPVQIDPTHRVALIRINRQFERGMTPQALYEATRKWWKVADIRRAIGSPYAPDWAMAVYGGIVRGVYRIESWERPTEHDLAGHPEIAKRWAFVGSRDLEMEKSYLFGDVSRHLRGGATGNPTQVPVRYVNCP